MPNDPNVPVIMISAGSGIAPFRHGLLKRWMSQYNWGITTGWFERIVNNLQISHHILINSCSIEDMVNFDISNALGQN